MGCAHFRGKIRVEVIDQESPLGHMREVRAAVGEAARRVPSPQCIGYPTATTSEVNSILYGIKDIEWRPGLGEQRLWFPKSQPPTPELTNLKLYPWQQRALRAWQARHHRGVIEAVTGAGKTRVAIAAAAEVLSMGGGVVIVVPSKDLMRQWKAEIDRLIVRGLGLRPRVGFMGDGHIATLRRP